MTATQVPAPARCRLMSNAAPMRQMLAKCKCASAYDATDHIEGVSDHTAASLPWRAVLPISGGTMYTELKLVTCLTDCLAVTSFALCTSLVQADASVCSHIPACRRAQPRGILWYAMPDRDPGFSSGVAMCITWPLR
jgi:hypothetical protein